jgi:hypothetical protein
MPHTTYTFSIQALNGVTPTNGKGAPSDSVNITTSHDGERDRDTERTREGFVVGVVWLEEAD